MGLKDLRQNMASWAGKVQKGQSLIVVKQSKPLFKIVPIDEWEEVEGYEHPQKIRESYQKAIKKHKPDFICK